MPRVSAHVIGRPRLNAVLDAGAPLTLLRGAAGSGKTTALVGWAFTCSARVVWLTVTPALATSPALADALLRALRGTDTDTGAGSTDPATGDGWPAVGHYLCDHEEPVVIVLDDAAALDRDAVFDLCRTVAVPSHVRLIVATNRPSPFDSDGIGLVIDTALISPEDLAFDTDEIRRALDVDEDTAVAVRAATEGFAAVVRAAALRGRAPDGTTIVEGAAAAVDDYLRSRMEEGTFGAGVLEGLIRISITDTVDLPLAQALSSDPDIGAALDEAEAFGFGRWSTDSGRRTFTIAAPARTLLRHDLLRRFPAEIRVLRRLAIEGALRRGTPFEGLRLAMEEDDLHLAAHVIMSGWSHLLDHDGRRVVALLGDLPLARLKQEPLVAMLLGICLNANRLRRVRGLQLLRMAISAANARRNTLSPTERLFIDEAAALAASQGSGKAFHAVSLLGGIHALNGDLPEARHYVEIIRDGSWDPAQLDGYRGTFYRVAEAMLAVEDGDLTAAKHHARAFLPHRATSEHWTTMATVEAWIALHEGDAAGGLERLESFARLRGREAGSPPARQALSRPRILLHLALGDIRAARGVKQRDAGADRFGTLLERARVALIDGRAPEAARLLSHTRLEPTTSRERAEAAAVQSAALHRVSPAAAQAVTAALNAQLADRGLRTPLALLSAEDFAAVRADLAPIGGAPLPARSALPSFAARPRLSSREQVVLHALTTGAPLPEIAAELQVSPNTLKTQLRSIYRKLDAANRTEALEQAARHGLLRG
ncbi:LuxR C-terminal-related transcriptional regulator [Microbacterium sp. NPDC077486]|uniref:helix-turn-helix transcriptional regulator n=1 Tax=Microbacterium sp. NPDC077486 TaxID=3154766 RepID=UPI00344A274E